MNNSVTLNANFMNYLVHEIANIKQTEILGGASEKLTGAPELQNVSV